MKTEVIKEKCISCALCPSLSELYAMGDDDKAVAVKTDDLTDQEEIEAKEAADSCPSEAIFVG